MVQLEFCLLFDCPLCVPIFFLFAFLRNWLGYWPLPRLFQRMAGTEEFKAQLNKQTDAEIVQLQQHAVSHKEAVAKLLLDIVQNVDIALPNAKKN